VPTAEVSVTGSIGSLYFDDEAINEQHDADDTKCVIWMWQKLFQICQFVWCWKLNVPAYRHKHVKMHYRFHIVFVCKML